MPSFGTHYSGDFCVLAHCCVVSQPKTTSLEEDQAAQEEGQDEEAGSSSRGSARKNVIKAQGKPGAKKGAKGGRPTKQTFTNGSKDSFCV